MILEKLNENFPKLQSLNKNKFSLNNCDRDYISLLKGIVYCWQKIKKQYGLNFIAKLNSSLENQFFSLKEKLRELLFVEVRNLQRNKSKSVDQLFLIIKKCSKIEKIAKAFLYEFSKNKDNWDFLCKRDVKFFEDSLNYINQKDRSVLNSSTKQYILGIKSKFDKN